MRKKVQDKLYRIVALIVLLVVSITVVLGVNYSAAVVYAATYVGENEYDSTSVLEDLDGAVINGEEFDILDYAFDSKKELQVISFVEYCYSYYDNQQDNYALYVYVWNPQGLNLAYDSTLNNIKLRFGTDESANYSSYPLYYCSRTGGDYEGLIYKFKVYLTSADKEEIFDTLNSLSRKYWVSEVELKTEGSSGAVAYYVSSSYTYSGYAAGYGSNNSSESTLSCATQQEDTLSLNCGYTYYRPEGTNGTDNYTQDNLSSVYFAVPNSYLEKYGYLCALSAVWTEAMLYPMLLTNNSDAYECIYNYYLGKDVSAICETDDNFKYSFNGYITNDDTSRYFIYGLNDSSVMYDLDWWDVAGYIVGGIIPFLYAYDDTFYKLGQVSTFNDYLSTIYSIFLNEDYSGDSVTETISSSALLSELKRASKAKYASYELVADEYASYLFEWYKDVEFHVDMREEYEGYDNAYLDLTNQTISYNGWWKALWGDDYTVTSNNFEGIPALQALTDDDFNSSYTDSHNAAALYVAESDYSDLKAYYDTWSSKTTYTDSSGTTYSTDGYTIYLCRFDKGTYVSQAASLNEKDTHLGTQTWDVVESNNYFFQETVYLGFDIIDVTFTNGETDTTIGVVMSPIDIVYASTSPVYTYSDTGCSDVTDSILLLLSVLLLIILLIIFYPVLKYVIKFVVWVICLPFKLIGKIFSSAKKGKKEKKERKNE